MGVWRSGWVVVLLGGVGALGTLPSALAREPRGPECLAALRSRPRAPATPLERWMEHQRALDLRVFYFQLHPEGAIQAADPDPNPSYRATWVRDAGIVMLAFQDLARDAASAELWREAEHRYAAFNRKLLREWNPSVDLSPYRKGHGEPRFGMRGQVFHAGWGRPQIDGPAYRAVSLVRLAERSLEEGREGYVRRYLFDPAEPREARANGRGPVQALRSDLDYLVEHWPLPSFDLWEEHRARHFHTTAVAAWALAEGAALAERLGDGASAERYRQAARAAADRLNAHWDWGAGYFRAALEHSGGADYKHSGLDASVILAANHVDGPFAPIAVDDDRVLATAARLEQEFRRLYPVSGRFAGAAPIGRYPEDRYDGVGFDGGNPWTLLTYAFGELHYRVAARLASRERIAVTRENAAFFRAAAPELDLREGQAIDAGDGRRERLLRGLVARGDAFLDIVRQLTPADGTQSEQLSRWDGSLRGAQHLVWNAAALRTALAARDRALARVPGAGVR